MHWFLNLRAGTKLLLTFGTLMVLLVVGAVNAYVTLMEVQSTQRDLYEQKFKTAVRLAGLRSDLEAARGSIYKILVLPNHSLQLQEQSTLKGLWEKATERMNELLATASELQGMEQTIKQLAATKDAFESTYTNEVVPLIMNEQRDQALKLILDVQAERIELMRTLTADLLSTAERNAETMIQASSKQTTNAIRVSAIAAIIAIVLGAAFTMYLNHIVAKPLVEVTAIAERIANRDLTVTVPANGRVDEVGTLISTFHRMVADLRQVTGDILGGVGVLASSSNEIMAAVSQVTASATETATAISQTTSTVQEVKQTVEVSSQKAKLVSESALHANDIAKSGSRAVDGMVTGIRRVQDSMKTILDSVTRLSEQGFNIGATIGVVDDIAEQSNLLAVNAAIEAAKAGEYGKGFSVVAQEVRSLAEQSKDATKQVRQILNDIQKGVAAAAKATEHGSNSVDQAIEQSEEASKAIQLLLECIGESAQSAMQIAASSQQQLIGMDQVALAMQNIRDASQQNVAATKQVEDSARDLHELGQNLSALARQYQT